MTAPWPSNGPSCSAPERPPQHTDGAERSAPSPRPGRRTCPNWRSGSDTRSGPHDPRQVPVPTRLQVRSSMSPMHRHIRSEVSRSSMWWSKAIRSRCGFGGVEPLPQHLAHQVARRDIPGAPGRAPRWGRLRCRRPAALPAGEFLALVVGRPAAASQDEAGRPRARFSLSAMYRETARPPPWCSPRW